MLHHLSHQIVLPSLKMRPIWKCGDTNECGMSGVRGSHPLRWISALLLLLPALCHAKDRTFLFTYAATIDQIPQDRVARVWLPVPQTNEDQQIETIRQDLPGTPSIGVDPRCGNRILYFVSKPAADAKLHFSILYRVRRNEVSEEAEPSPASNDCAFLQPDALVPVGGRPQKLIADQTLPTDQMKLARLLYDTVDKHMQYRKVRPGWGRGDACWAAESGFGNCTDFHSLFISLARSEGIPCKFEIGFPIPANSGKGEVTGYHCWAKFHPTGRGWVPVDISEANKNPSRRDYFFGHLDENRIAFSTGRDITLVPKQNGPPVNFFIYPYVEVDGKAVAAEQIEKQFRFEDMKEEM